MPGRTPRKKKKAEPASRGLAPGEVAASDAPAKVRSLAEAVCSDGGEVLRIYKDPLGGHWQMLVVLPIGQVKPTPYQRDLSPTHVERLSERIDQLGRFLDPVIAYRAADGEYWTPNGHHRLAAMGRLGARSIVALVMPDEEIAYKILALNTEKAHNVREKALEVIRMARALAQLDSRPENEFAVEFEEPTFLTLGVCYERKSRFSGGAYQAVLKRVEAFLDQPLSKTLPVREKRAGRLLELDDAVSEAVAKLKERGFESPYLKAFVIARVNPLRFKRGARAQFDETLDKMIASAGRFDPSKIKADQVASAAGPPDE